MEMIMAQYYKITNITNYKSYIGIIVSPNKTYLDRFLEHTEGKGSVWIWRDIQNGLATIDDFVIELIFEDDQATDIDGLEERLIKLHDTLYPNGYNGNCGNHIVLTEESKEKRKTTFQRNKLLGKHKSPGRSGMAVYRYSNGTIAKLPTSHQDVIQGIVKHINYDPDAKYRIKQIKLIAEKLKNYGQSDRQVEFAKRIKEISKTYPSLESWQKGREKYRERLSSRKFTEKEIKSMENRPNLVRQQWAELTNDQRMCRTSSGLTAMNSSIQCEYCGKITNQGNHSRWHGLQCKKK